LERAEEKSLLIEVMTLLIKKAATLIAAFFMNMFL
jgi:hypothetical protein